MTLNRLVATATMLSVRGVHVDENTGSATEIVAVARTAKFETIEQRSKANYVPALDSGSDGECPLLQNKCPNFKLIWLPCGHRHCRSCFAKERPYCIYCEQRIDWSIIDKCREASGMFQLNVATCKVTFVQMWVYLFEHLKFIFIAESLPNKQNNH